MIHYISNSLPLVLLPGTGCNNSLWSRLLPTLPKFIEPITSDLLSCVSVETMLGKIADIPHQQAKLTKLELIEMPDALGQIVTSWLKKTGLLV